AGGAILDLALGDATHRERERDVVGDRHVRPHRVGLEHDAEGALLGHEIDAGVGVEHRLAGDLDRTGGGGFEAGQAAQNRGLAAARRPEQRERVALGDLERHAVDRDEIAEALGQIADTDEGQGAAHVSREARVARNRVNASSRSTSWITASAATRPTLCSLSTTSATLMVSVPWACSRMMAPSS